jgi:hypothetical protein
LTDNVEDGLRPILQAIQERLGRIEATLEKHTALLAAVIDESRTTKRMAQAALGGAGGAELQAEDAERAAIRANRRLDELVARMEALESR